MNNATRNADRPHQVEHMLEELHQAEPLFDRLESFAAELPANDRECVEQFLTLSGHVSVILRQASARLRDSGAES